MFAKQHIINTLLILSLSVLTACSLLPKSSPAPVSTTPEPATVIPIPAPAPAPPPIKPIIALALGGGGARGFSHIGVIKVLENNGIKPDIIVGTSAGAVVGSLYANGLSATQLQRLSQKIDEKSFLDWRLPNIGVLEGVALQSFIQQYTEGRRIEEMPIRFAAVATNLANGSVALFDRGNLGLAVRASASVPGIFQPVTIAGKRYVDGGLVSPVPVLAARKMGANFIIAVDISARPSAERSPSTVQILLDTFSIMGNKIAEFETSFADVVIRPQTQQFSSTSFADRNALILQGEVATQEKIVAIKKALDKLEQRQ